MNVITVRSTFLATHVNNKTMFVTFKNKRAACNTQKAIVHYIYSHKTLPTTHDTTTDPTPLHYPDDWVYLRNDVGVMTVSPMFMNRMCEVHNAGLIEVRDTHENVYTNYDILSLAYNPTIREPRDMPLEEAKQYLEYISCSGDS